MDLRDVLTLIWKRRWLVLAVFATCVGLSVAFVAQQAREYESTASLALTPDTDGQSLISPDALTALLGTYAETAKSRLLLERSAGRLGRPLGGTIETETVAGTGILRITGRAGSPDRAAQNANAVAAAFTDSIRNNNLIVAAVVDPAQPQTDPVQPRPALSFAIAGVLGLFGGVVLAFVFDQLRQRVTNLEDLRKLTSAPLIGRLPRNRDLARRRSSIVWDDARDVDLQESYRALRTNLRFVYTSDTGILQLTSPEPGAGKSTVAANLAIALGQIGVKTILVDGDLRRPRVHQIFELSNDAGLSTLMVSKDVDPLVTLQRTRYENLLVLPCGPPLLDPTEMLSVRIGAVLARLGQLEALIIVDSPPLLPVSDSRLIAAHTDGVIMVVASGSERPPRLQLAIERLQLTGAPLTGIVLNKARTDSVSEGSVYGYGGYDAEARHATAPTA